MQPFRPRFMPWSERNRLALGAKSPDRRGLITLFIAIAGLVLSAMNLANTALSERAEQRRLLLEEISTATEVAIKVPFAAITAQYSAEPQKALSDEMQARLKEYLDLDKKLLSPWAWMYTVDSLQGTRAQISQEQKLDSMHFQHIEDRQRLQRDIDGQTRATASRKHARRDGKSVTPV